MIALIAFAVVVLGVALWLVLRAHRTPGELRGDWWPRFEQEFRVYAERNAATRNLRARNRRPR